MMLLCTVLYSTVYTYLRTVLYNYYSTLYYSTVRLYAYSRVQYVLLPSTKASVHSNFKLLLTVGKCQKWTAATEWHRLSNGAGSDGGWASAEGLAGWWKGSLSKWWRQTAGDHECVIMQAGTFPVLDGVRRHVSEDKGAYVQYVQYTVCLLHCTLRHPTRVGLRGGLTSHVTSDSWRH
jgi:hypothetical protein